MKTRGVVRVNVGGGAELERSTDSTITTVLSDVVFPVPDSSVSRSFDAKFVIALTATVSVAVAKGLALKAAVTVTIFSSRALFVDRTTIFGVEGFWQESWVFSVISNE